MANHGAAIAGRRNPMGQYGALGWVMVTVGVVLVVLGVVLGGATWGTTILISVFGLALVGVGALMAIRARRPTP
jgi:uncharacterized membrane protein HdeD (DUF308 family)